MLGMGQRQQKTEEMETFGLTASHESTAAAARELYVQRTWTLSFYPCLVAVLPPLRLFGYHV